MQSKEIGNIWVYAANNIKLALPATATAGDVYVVSVSEDGDLEVSGPVEEDPRPSTGTGRFVCMFTCNTPIERLAVLVREVMR